MVIVAVNGKTELVCTGNDWCVLYIHSYIHVLSTENDVWSDLLFKWLICGPVRVPVSADTKGLLTGVNGVKWVYTVYIAGNFQ